MLEWISRRTRAYLVDAALVEDVPPRFEAHPAILYNFAEHDLEDQVGHDFGILAQALEDAADQSLRLEDLRLEPRIARRQKG